LALSVDIQSRAQIGCRHLTWIIKGDDFVTAGISEQVTYYFVIQSVPGFVPMKTANKAMAKQVQITNGV
jgi:hypothetical protein